MKTEAVRILEALHVAHSAHRFRATTLSAEEAAEALRVPLDAIVKTIVVEGDRTGVMRVCLPGARRLSLKRLAQVSGNKRAILVSAGDLRRLTGYLRGGVSPLGSRAPHPVYCDAAVLTLPGIFVNGGMRGLQIHLAPEALVRAANAVVADLSEETSPRVSGAAGAPPSPRAQRSRARPARG
jgi:Cys-tRNA(Pro)/Cys-tRNA(Cys) deacylase